MYFANFADLTREVCTWMLHVTCHIYVHTSRWWGQQSSTVQLYGIFISSRTLIDLTEYSDDVPDSSLETTSPDHQAVSPKRLLNTTCYLCKKEENIFVLPSCLRWLRGRCRQFLLRITYHSGQSVQYVWELSRTTSPATSLILRLPTTADVFGYLHRRASHIDTHSLWGLSLTGIIWKTI